MDKKQRVAVLGSGGWGTALAITAFEAGCITSLLSVFENEIEILNKTRENPLLKGIKIPSEIALSSDLTDIADSDILILAVPSIAIRSASKKIREHLNPKTILVSVAKGLEKDSLKRLSEVMKEEIPNNPVVVLSGPSHAEEVAKGIPTSVTVACENEKIAEYIQRSLCCENFRIYTNTDMVGVEICGMVKNVIALAAGICDGLGLGDNTKAALMTRGMSEVIRLGTAMGGKKETFSGLAGIGDLIVTCTSMHSRNRRAGILIGQGVPVEEALSKIGTVEGYHASKNAWELARRENIEMPIIEECYRILYNGSGALDAIQKLMNRPYKNEQM